MSDEALAAYKQELEALREEYAGKINLYIGIELDTLGPVQQAEYAIGSTAYPPADEVQSHPGYDTFPHGSHLQPDHQLHSHPDPAP